MRLIKTFGLAAVAAIAAMAFLGASSASANFATALCTTYDETKLACDSPYTGHVEATAGATFLETELGTVTCKKSSILGNALGLAAASTPLVGHLESVKFEECTFLGLGCTVTTKELGLITLLKTALNKGLVESEGTWVLVDCLAGGIHCEYGGSFHAGTAVGHATGGFLSSTSLGTVTATATEVKRRKALPVEGCPEESKWTASYTIQLPHALFIKS